MSDDLRCDTCRYYLLPVEDIPCKECLAAFNRHKGKPNFKPKPRTNGDVIRKMTDEELAEWITGMDRDNPCPPDRSCSCLKSNCMKGWLDWMRREAES